MSKKTGSLQASGWGNYRAYPLLLEWTTEAALVKMMGAQNLSKGKALNVAVKEGLTSLGYMTRVTVCNPHRWEPKWNVYGDKYQQCSVCREVGEMLLKPPMTHPEGMKLR